MAPICARPTIVPRATNPRLKATSADDVNKVVKFHMVDITNMPTPEAGHVRDLELRLTGPSQITILFTFVGSGKESIERIELARKAYQTLAEPLGIAHTNQRARLSRVRFQTCR